LRGKNVTLKVSNVAFAESVHRLTQTLILNWKLIVSIFIEMAVAFLARKQLIVKQITASRD